MASTFTDKRLRAQAIREAAESLGPDVRLVLNEWADEIDAEADAQEAEEARLAGRNCQ